MCSPGHCRSPWLPPAAPLFLCPSWHRRGRGSARWLPGCPGCTVPGSLLAVAGRVRAGLQQVRPCCSRLEAVTGPRLPAPLARGGPGFAFPHPPRVLGLPAWAAGASPCARRGQSNELTLCNLGPACPCPRQIPAPGRTTGARAQLCQPRGRSRESPSLTLASRGGCCRRAHAGAGLGREPGAAEGAVGCDAPSIFQQEGAVRSGFRGLLSRAVRGGRRPEPRQPPAWPVEEASPRSEPAEPGGREGERDPAGQRGGQQTLGWWPGLAGDRRGRVTEAVAVLPAGRVTTTSLAMNCGVFKELVCCHETKRLPR